MGQEVTPFAELVGSLGALGRDWHRDAILEHSRANAPRVVNTIRAIPEQPGPCLIVSAGPSLQREGVLARIFERFNGTLIAVDAAYVQCLRAGVVPDYVLTLDPHPTRMVRWFGDPDLEANLNGDDYFARQDLDVAFRSEPRRVNDENIAQVNRRPVPLVIATTAAANVVKRTSLFERYWFVPLVDAPEGPASLTVAMVEATGAPAMNTGGTVGTAAWVFAHQVLRSRKIAVVGMDMGYYPDTPIEETQSARMLEGDSAFYPVEENPWGRRFYTDPTYAWYRENLLALLEANDARLTNCTGAGLLQGPGVDWEELEAWLESCS